MKKILGLFLAASMSMVLVAGCSSSKASGPSGDQSSSSQSNSKLNEYEGIIKTARSLNEDGDYKGSNKALNGINIVQLNKKGYSSLKDEFFQLQKSNDAFLLKKAKQANAQTNSNGGSNGTQLNTNNSFDNYSQFTGDYQFYNYDPNRLQDNLVIDDDGTVVQQNTDGTTFHGIAKITPYSQSGILSYDVTTGTNKTKTITSNVKVVVTWSNGENETYYGYVSYDGYTVLTDGNTYHGDLVNEVWIHD